MLKIIFKNKKYYFNIFLNKKHYKLYTIQLQTHVTKWTDTVKSIGGPLRS